MFLLFPLVNLIAFGCGASTCYLIAFQTASTASLQKTFMTACNEMVKTARNLETSSLGKFAKLKPVGGLQGCGVDMYVEACDYSNANALTTYGPNAEISSPVDPSTKIYEVRTRVTYDVGPFMNLAGVPFIGQIPMIGTPGRLSFQANRALEHPEGFEGSLNFGSSNTLLSGLGTPAYNSSNSAVSQGTLPKGIMSNAVASWNYPQKVNYIGIFKVPADQGSGFWAMQMSWGRNDNLAVTELTFELVPIFTDANTTSDLLENFKANGITAVDMGTAGTPEGPYKFAVTANPSPFVLVQDADLEQAILSRPNYDAPGNNVKQIAQTGWQKFKAWFPTTLYQ